MTAEIPCPALRRPPIAARGLTATEWSSAEEKARIGNALLGFIARGMPESAWNKRLYTRLSMMFGFIAHYNVHGFWGAQLASTEARIGFLDQMQKWPCWGSPTHTWCDVEREIATRLRESGLVTAYRHAARLEIESRERQELYRLTAKYAAATDPAGAETRPTFSRKPEQIALF